MKFSDYKDFKDFCNKNGFTTEKGLKNLIEEYKKGLSEKKWEQAVDL